MHHSSDHVDHPSSGAITSRPTSSQLRKLGRAQMSVKGRSALTGILWGILGILLVILLWFAVQVILANRAASSVFDVPYCWLRPGEDVTNLKELSFSGTGFFIPNPARQLNRRLLGLGIDDMEVRSPHFAILAIDNDGQARIAGWSYRKFGFFTEDQAVLRQFVSPETEAACRAALNR